MKGKVRLYTPIGTYVTNGSIEIDVKTEMDFVARCMSAPMWEDLLLEPLCNKVDQVYFCEQDRKNISFEFIWNK